MRNKTIIKLLVSGLGIFAVYALFSKNNNEQGVTKGDNKKPDDIVPNPQIKDLEVLKYLNNGKPTILAIANEVIPLQVIAKSIKPVEFTWKIDGKDLKGELTISGQNEPLTYTSKTELVTTKSNKIVSCKAKSNKIDYDFGSVQVLVLPQTQNWINWDKAVIELAFGRFKKDGDVYILPNGFNFSFTNSKGKKYDYFLSEDIKEETEEKVIVNLMNKINATDISSDYTVSEIGTDLTNPNYAIRFIAKNSGSDYNINNALAKSNIERDAIFNKRYDAAGINKSSANGLKYNS